MLTSVAVTGSHLHSRKTFNELGGLTRIKDEDAKNLLLEVHRTNQGLPMRIIGQGDCFLLFSRGEPDAAAVVGINKCEHGQEYWVNKEEHKFFWHQTYFDVIEPADTFIVNSQWHRLYIPGRRAKMWVLR
ncbi:hypothetical protein [Endozoicomonas sp. 2B-B]